MADLDLAFESYGASSVTPLILIHGFLASSRNWRTVAKRLAAVHRIYVLDMRNHGNSPCHPLLDYPSMAGDLLAFMDYHGIQQAHLVGHSMGGKVAMWFAMHHPHRVAELIIADISPVTYQHGFDSLVAHLRALPLASLSNRKQAEEALAESIPSLAYRQFLLQNLLLRDGAYYWRIDLDVIQANAHHIVGFPDVRGGYYARPALFIGGALSNYIQPEVTYRMFPLATLCNIPDTGHWLHVEAPEAFGSKIIDWIDRDDNAVTG